MCLRRQREARRQPDSDLLHQQPPTFGPRRASQSNLSLVADSHHVLSGYAIPPTVPLVGLKVDPVARLVRVAAGAHDEAARAQQDAKTLQERACGLPRAEQHVNRVACETVITQAPWVKKA